MTIKLTWIFLLLMPVAVAQNLPEETFIDELEDVERHSGERLARFTYSDEDVVVIHDDQFEEPAIRNLPAISGDIVRTANRSYAEVEFIDGSLLQMSDLAEVEFQAINEIYQDESLTIVKLHEGKIFLHVTDDWIGNENRLFRIDTASGSAYIEYPGIYSVNIEGSMMVFKVFRGFGELSGEQDSAAIQSGEYSTIRHMTRPTRVRPFNSFNSDRFERWAYSRRPARDSVSEKYVDASISAYANDLDDSGDWRYEGDLGRHVWVPSVEVSWRPYTAGYWSRRGGVMTWISYDRFGWLTHHYGRWGWSVSLGWYWIPDRYYSPAWVAWTSYNNYIGWCPLGYWNRPYYYQYDRPNVVIINNHRHHWSYVSSTTIINRGRDYSYRPIATRGSRRVTTRPIHVNAGDFNDSRQLTRVIRDPKINRSRSIEANRTRSATFVTGRAANSEQTNTIRGRNTGTRATSRYSSGTSAQRGDASSVFDRSSNPATVRQRGDSSSGVNGSTARPTTRMPAVREVPTRKENSSATGTTTRTPTNRTTTRPSSSSTRPTTKPSDNKDDNRTRRSSISTVNSRDSSAIREVNRNLNDRGNRSTQAQPNNRRGNTARTNRTPSNSRSRVQSSKPSTASPRSTNRSRANTSRQQYNRDSRTSSSRAKPRATKPNSRTTTQRSTTRASKPNSRATTQRSTTRASKPNPRASTPRSTPRAKPRSNSSSRPRASTPRPRTQPRSNQSARPKPSNTRPRTTAKPRPSSSKRPAVKRPSPRPPKRDNN